MSFSGCSAVGSASVDSSWVSTGLDTKYRYLTLLSQSLSPCIKVEVSGALKRSFPKVFRLEAESLEWELLVIIMSLTDYQLTQFEKEEGCFGYDGSYDFGNLWDRKKKSVRYSVDEIQSRHLNQNPIAVLKLSNKNMDPVVYPVDSTGPYCVYTCLSSAEKDLELNLETNFQQWYGKLNKWDHWDMYKNAFISLIYLFSSLLYFYCFSSSLQSIYNVTEMKLQLGNVTLQHRILVYMLGKFLVYFWKTSHLYMLNKIGPENTSISEALAFYAYNVSNSGYLTWGLYNLLLLSSGNLFFSDLDNSKYLLFIRLLSLITFVSFLWARLEAREVCEAPLWWELTSKRMYKVLRIECLIGAICVCFGFVRTYFHLCANGSTGVANRLLATMILALIHAHHRAWMCGVIPHSCETSGSQFRVIKILEFLSDAIGSLCYYTYKTEYMTIVLIASLWAFN